MGFWRNPEVRRSLLVCLGVSVVLGGMGCILGMQTGLCVLLACLAMTGVHLTVTCRRYRRIAELAAQIDRLLHTGSDVTFSGQEEGELSLLENELQKLTQRLSEQSQRLQEDKQYLADSLADVSHQLRTPLTSMHLLLELLQEPGLTPERKGALLRELHGLLSRVDWLVTALLKLSKLDAGTVQLRQDAVALEALVKEACEPLQIAAELREQTLLLSASGTFTGDAAWTAEALGNIVKNCMEHTPSGGSIRVEAQENPLYSEITVTDTGSGIDKNDLPHIFERFYKGKNSSDASYGIGLALARTIITGQNGTVKAENLPQGGARFVIRFYKTAV